jgi:hypothetical protein
MTKFHAGTRLPRTINRGRAKPEATTAPYHIGSGAPKTTHSPPRPGGAVNSANYGMQKLGRRK